MARKVKCRACGKLIEKEDAYPVPHGKKIWYYCSKEHALRPDLRSEMYQSLEVIFGKKIRDTTLYKEFDELGRQYTYEEMVAYIDANYQYLCAVMSKDFDSDFARIRYLAAIFKKNMPDFVKPLRELAKKKPKEMDEVDWWNGKKNTGRKGMDYIMEDILGNK